MRAVSAAFLIAATALPGAALAQSRDVAIDARVDRLEHEMRAVQRKVFPGSPDGRYVEPEVTPQGGGTAAAGAPATNPVVDLTARVNALEEQLSRLTDRIEVMQHRQQQDEEAFTAFRRATEARLSAIDASLSASAAPPSRSPDNGPAGDADQPARPRPAKPAGAAAQTPPPAAAATTKDPARAQQLAAIKRTHTDDPAEDDYLYGYHLWEAKLFPEAETVLKGVVTDYPKHRRASYAQNLLGRAYLDDNKPSLASIAFYDSYKKYPDGERASDSLFYLASALMKLNKPADACKVYGELSDVYGPKLTAQRKAEILRGRQTAKCAS